MQEAVAVRYYNENYVVNEYGELFSLFGLVLRKLKPYINNNGYVMYRLRINGKTIQKSAHHLSYWVNIGHFDTSDGLQIDHIDGNKLNNHYTNLRRVTPRDNINNINTMGALPNKSRSGYRITNNDCLPSKYVKSKEFDTINSQDKDIICIDGKYKRMLLCSLCGDFTQGKLCLKCFNDKKSERVPPKEKLIEDLMTNKSLVKLAKQYGVSDNAYRKWLAKRGLPTKSKDIKTFTMSV